MFVIILNEYQLEWIIERRNNDSTDSYFVTIHFEPRRDSSAVLVNAEQLLSIISCSNIVAI
jgi:hypothetical protein